MMLDLFENLKYLESEIKMAEIQYYYWDNEFYNKEGQTLRQCLDQYGIGKQKLGKGVVMEVIFLDKKKDFGYSWCLRCYNKESGKNIVVRLYDNSRVYGPPPKPAHISNSSF